jgi:hypothetical protein
MSGPARAALALIVLLGAIGTARAQEVPAKYPAMAPIERYRIANRSDEIALARSAAPPSISAAADVLVLGPRGYETAAAGTNGFVCLVERSWGAGIDDPEFWNPSTRGPLCFNPPAARSVLPPYLKRTEWVLAGLSSSQIRERIKAAVAERAFSVPEPSAMCYMLSKQGQLGDTAGHWFPHLMLFLPRVEAATWGGNLPGSGVVVQQADPDPGTVILIPVRTWSDGSPAIGDHPM